MKCIDCNGTGEIKLLTSIVKCERCKKVEGFKKLVLPFVKCKFPKMPDSKEMLEGFTVKLKEVVIPEGDGVSDDTELYNCYFLRTTQWNNY